MSSKENETLKI